MTEKIISITESLALLKHSQQVFNARLRQVLKWFFIEFRATDSALKFMAFKPRKELRDLLTTAETFSRDRNSSNARLRFGNVVFHKRKQRLSPLSPTLASYSKHRPSRLGACK